MMSATTPPHNMEKSQFGESSPANALTHPHVPYPIRAMLKKEFRELLPWGLGMGVLFSSLLMFILLNYMQEMLRSQFAAIEIFRSSELRIAINISCPLIALLLGVIQFSKEIKPDLYAMLMHRPIYRRRLFILKAFAGLTTYLFNVGIPLAAFFCWILAKNEHWPSKLVEYAVIPWIVLWMGSLCYFLGALLVIRPLTKWYGSLVLPVCWPILIMFYAESREKLWQSAVIFGLGLLPLALASAGNFTTRGQIRQQPWYARLSLGVVALFGIYSGLIFGFLIVAAITEPFIDRHDEEWREYGLTKDNTEVVSAYYYGKQIVRTPAGKEIATSRRSENILARSSRMVTIPPQTRNMYYESWVQSFRYLYPHSQQMTIGGITYSAYAGRFSIHLYRQDKREIAGIIGPDGVSGVKMGRKIPSQPFTKPVALLAKGFFISGNTVYSLNDELKLKAAFVSPDNQDFTDIEMARLANDFSFETNTSILVISTSTHLYQIKITDLSSPIELLNTYPRELPKYNPVPLWNGDRLLAIRYDYPLRTNQYRPDGPSILVRFNADGTTSRKEVMPTGIYDSTPALYQALHYSTPMWISTAGYGALKSIHHWQMNSFQFHNALRRAWIGGPILGLFSAIIMWLIMAQQSFGRGRKILWAVLAFLCGPAMLLLRPIIVPTHVLEPCPDCHKKRPIESSECPHCHNPWSAPERDGREILTAT